MIVVKVGGSLYDLPDLKPRLNAFLQPLAAAEPVIVVPGGGAEADAVREQQRLYHLDDITCDILAKDAMETAAKWLCELIDRAEFIVFHIMADKPGVFVYGAGTHEMEDPDLPRTWDVTSDSIAVSVACLAVADRLILLKSADPPTTDYSSLAAAGYVDAHFPTIISQFEGTVEFVNLRETP